jgi:hypothetical protein
MGGQLTFWIGGRRFGCLRALRSTVGCLWSVGTALLVVALLAAVPAPAAAASSTPGWSVQPTPNPVPSTSASGSSLSGVSCPSKSACVAVGYSVVGVANQAFAERWANGRWTLSPTATLPAGASDGQLSGVSCSSANACIAVGSYTASGTSGPAAFPLAERWNGLAWMMQSVPIPSGAAGGNLFGVSCTAANACTAVGTAGPNGGPLVTLVERWNGSKWVVQPTPNPAGATESFLNGVSCASASACTAVGTYDDQTLAGRAGRSSPPRLFSAATCPGFRVRRRAPAPRSGTTTLGMMCRWRSAGTVRAGRCRRSRVRPGNTPRCTGCRARRRAPAPPSGATTTRAAPHRRPSPSSGTERPGRSSRSRVRPKRKAANCGACHARRGASAPPSATITTAWATGRWRSATRDETRRVEAEQRFSRLPTGLTQKSPPPARPAPLIDQSADGDHLQCGCRPSSRRPPIAAEGDRPDENEQRADGCRNAAKPAATTAFSETTASG